VVDRGIGTAADGPVGEAGAGPGTGPSAQLEGGLLFTDIPGAALPAPGEARDIRRHD
jgi:hypothetical protein